jgi:transposase-like protein
MGPNQSALFKGRDHVTIWRWVQRYAPEMNRRCRRELRRTNGSWRVDETYLRVAGNRSPMSEGINVDGNSSYPKVIAELRKTGALGFLIRFPVLRAG